MSWRRTAAAVSWLTVSSACGGGSTTDLPLRVTSPAAPTTSDWSVSGRITTQAGVPIAGAVVSPPGLPTVLTSAAGTYTVAGLGSPSQDPYPLEITANNYLRRRVWVRWQPGDRTGVNVNLISLSPPFSLNFYRELARDAQERPGALEPLQLWPGGNPNVYIRTVDQNGDAIAQDGAQRRVQTPSRAQWLIGRTANCRSARSSTVRRRGRGRTAGSSSLSCGSNQGATSAASRSSASSPA